MIRKRSILVTVTSSLLSVALPAGSAAAGVGVPSGTQVFAPPPTIAADCSADVTKPLYDWINALPQGTAAQPTEVQFAAGGCYEIDGMVFLRGLTDWVFEGNGARFEQSSIVKGELKGDPPPNRPAYCGIGNRFVKSSGTVPTGVDIMWFVEGGCDLVFEDMDIEGTNTAGSPGGSRQQDSAIQLAGSQRVLVTANTVNGVWGDFVTVAGLHEAPYGGLYFPCFDVTVSNNVFSNSGRQGVSVVYADRVAVTGNSFAHMPATALDLEAAVGGGVEGDVLVDSNSFRDYTYLVSAVTYSQLFSLAFSNNRTGPIKVQFNSKTKYPGHDVSFTGNTAGTATDWPNSWDTLFSNEVTGLVSTNSVPVAPPTKYFVHANSSAGQIAVQNNVLNPGSGAPQTFLPYPLAATSSSNGTECGNITSLNTVLDTRANPPELDQCVTVAPTLPSPAQLPIFVTSLGSLVRTAAVRSSSPVLRAAKAIGVQPGTATCGSLQGTVQFTPPLVSGGSSPEVASIQMTMNSCAAVSGAPPSVGHAAGVFVMASNDCGSLGAASPRPTSMAIKWSPTGDGATTIRWPGFGPDPASTGLQLGGGGTTASGSYAGSDVGGSTTADILLGTNPASIAATCASPNGLQILPIAGGSVSIG